MEGVVGTGETGRDWWALVGAVAVAERPPGHPLSGSSGPSRRHSNLFAPSSTSQQPVALGSTLPSTQSITPRIRDTEAWSSRKWCRARDCDCRIILILTELQKRAELS